MLSPCSLLSKAHEETSEQCTVPAAGKSEGFGIRGSRALDGLVVAGMRGLCSVTDGHGAFYVFASGKPSRTDAPNRPASVLSAL